MIKARKTGSFRELAEEEGKNISSSALRVNFGQYDTNTIFDNLLFRCSLHWIGWKCYCLESYRYANISYNRIVQFRSLYTLHNIQLHLSIGLFVVWCMHGQFGMFALVLGCPVVRWTVY